MTAEPRLRGVEVTDGELLLDLTDGRQVPVALARIPRLASARPEALRHWEFLGDGEGIRWAELDEDLSLAGLLAESPETFRQG